MKTYDARIIVAGLAKVGKSTIIQEIKIALEMAGIEVEIVDELEQVVPSKFQENRLNEVASKTKVVIEERHMYNTPDGARKIQGIGGEY